jgi:hypothetical protein
MSLPWVQNTVNVGGCFQHDSLPLGSPSGVPASEHQASDASQHEPHYGQPVPTVAGNSSSSQTSRAVLQQLSEAAAAEAAAVRSTLIAAQAALQGPGAGTPGPGSSTGSDAAGLHTPAIPHLPQDLTLPSRASATTDDSSSSAAASSPFNTPWALQEPRLQPQHPPPSLATLARQMSDLLEKTPVDTFDLSARPQLALYLDTTLERVSEVCSTVASEDVTPRTSLAGTGEPIVFNRAARRCPPGSKHVLEPVIRNTDKYHTSCPACRRLELSMADRLTAGECDSRSAEIRRRFWFQLVGSWYRSGRAEPTQPCSVQPLS